MEILSYPYHAKRVRFVAGFVFSVLLAIGWGFIAATNNTGTKIWGFQLGVAAATTFYWCVDGLFVSLLLLGTGIFMVGSSRAHCVVLTESYISAPKSLLMHDSTIVRFSDIKGIKFRPGIKEPYLAIKHAGGRLSISGLYLPRHALSELHAELMRRLNLKPASGL